MTRDEAVTRIKRQLAFRQSLDNDIIEEMQTAQVMLEASATKPWFMISERAIETTIADEPRVPVDPTFIAEVDDSKMVYIPDAPAEGDDPIIFLDKMDYDEAMREFLHTESGPPQAYALVGEYFHMFPTPDAVYTLRQHFYETQAPLTTNIENNWLKHVPYLLMGTTLLAMAEGPMGNAAAVKTAERWITAGLKVLWTQNTLRDSNNRTYQMGGPAL